MIVLIFFLLGSISQLNAQNSMLASIVSMGKIDCFPEDAKTDKGQNTYCEASAVVYYNNKIVIASDKAIPGHSSVFFYQFTQPDGLKNLNYIDNKLIKNGSKFEDFSLSPDKKTVFLTTGFDRVDTLSNKNDGYNTVFYWPVGNENKPKILEVSGNDTLKSSVSLRKKISKALANSEFPKGMSYFKVEGLTAIPGNQLLFGIREAGKNFDDFNYAVKLISVSYVVKDGTIKLNNDWKQTYNFTPDTTGKWITPIAISSIEYDTWNKMLWITTSLEFEKGDKGYTGAYLWCISYADYLKKLPLTPVCDQSGKPILFNQKVEGVSVIDQNTLFLVCDDDRLLGEETPINEATRISRTPNQATYYILKHK